MAAVVAHRSRGARSARRAQAPAAKKMRRQSDFHKQTQCRAGGKGQEFWGFATTSCDRTMAATAPKPAPTAPYSAIGNQPWLLWRPAEKGIREQPNQHCSYGAGRCRHSQEPRFVNRCKLDRREDHSSDAGAIIGWRQRGPSRPHEPGDDNSIHCRCAHCRPASAAGQRRGE